MTPETSPQPQCLQKLSEPSRCSGFLTFGVVSEQFKTRRETYIAERDTKSADNAQEVTLRESLHLWPLPTHPQRSHPTRSLRVEASKSFRRRAFSASGVKYTDKVFGGGEAVAPGLLVGVGYVMKVDGAVVLDTTRRPQVFLFGQRKGFAGGLCAGTEEVLRSMRNGGRRVITVPPEMAFGDRGTTLPQVRQPRRQTHTSRRAFVIPRRRMG